MYYKVSPGRVVYVQAASKPKSPLRYQPARAVEAATAAEVACGIPGFRILLRARIIDDRTESLGLGLVHLMALRFSSVLATTVGLLTRTRSRAHHLVELQDDRGR